MGCIQQSFAKGSEAADIFGIVSLDILPSGITAKLGSPGFKGYET